MTTPPQGSDETGRPGDPDRQITEPAPTLDRTQPAPAGPGTPYGQPPAQPYGQSAPPYGEPTPTYVRPPVPGAGPVPGPGTAPQPAAQPGGTYGQPAWPQAPQYGGPPPQYGAAPYQQPMYAPPGGPYGPPPPAQKSKVGLIAAITGGILLVIVGVVVLVMALQSTVLDPASVERDVAAQFEEREGVAISLSCPEDMEVDKGATYECSGTTADDEDVTLQITIQDESSAAYTWTEP